MITKSTHQPTQQERLADFKAKAVYVPELNFVIGNQFSKQFNQGAKL
jgi:endo-beta-N-acetylglucosaminidase D